MFPTGYHHNGSVATYSLLASVRFWALCVSWITCDHLFILYVILFCILYFKIKATSYEIGRNNFNVHEIIANNKKAFHIAFFA